jgi:hypothetical protein
MDRVGEILDGEIIQGLLDDLEFWGQVDNGGHSDVVEGAVQEEYLAELETLKSFEIAEDAGSEQFLGEVDNSNDLEIVDSTIIEQVLGGLNSIESSEELKPGILEAFITQTDTLEAFQAVEDVIINDNSREIDTEESIFTTATPPSDTSLVNPTYFRNRIFPCPFQISLGCPRTFSHPGYAKNHSKIHSHHIRCDYKGCRSRFRTRESLDSHLNTIHGLEDIADLDHSCKGRLRRVDGEYNCRFRDLLGCQKTFSQNGHANRHAVVHFKAAIPCNVRGCRMKFMKRCNWEAHFWANHYQVLS